MHLLTTLTLTVLALAGTSASASELVLTPFGHWPARCVHGAPSGAEVHNIDDTAFSIAHPSLGGEAVVKQRCNLTHEERELVRGNFNARLGKGQSRARAGGHVGPMDEGNGWQAYVKWQAPGVSSFLGDFGVPVKPAEQAQTLFYFTGLQNIDWVPPQPQPVAAFDIIQPVAQYGYSAAGGVEGSWTMASWYVTLGSDVVFSKLVPVDVGEVIFGNMTRLDESGTWFINSVATKAGTNSTLTLHRTILKEQPWTYVTLEVYDVDDCAQQPPKGTTIPFTNLALVVNGTAAEPKWAVGQDGQQPSKCGSSIKIKSPSEVTIIF